MLQELGRFDEGIMPGTKNCVHLPVKIGVVLCLGPDREDQMHGIDARDAPLVHPVAQDRGLVVHQATQIGFQNWPQMGCALKDFIGKETAFAR